MAHSLPCEPSQMPDELRQRAIDCRTYAATIEDEAGDADRAADWRLVADRLDEEARGLESLLHWAETVRRHQRRFGRDPAYTTASAIAGLAANVAAGGRS